MSEALWASQSVPAEERARADWYGVLARLWYEPPDAAWLAALAQAEPDEPARGAALAVAWQPLQELARSMDAAEVAEEFERLFGGVGKPEIAPYASVFVAGFLNERPLTALRSDLAQLGLARSERMAEPEDHVACLCEVMRYLIAGEDAAVANLAQQQRFFSVHLHPWVPSLCEAVQAHPEARFYGAVAALTQAFMAVEAQGFELL